MLRTNSKAAMQNIRNYIDEWALDTLEERNDWNRKEGGKVYNLEKIENRAAMILDIFEEEKPGSDNYYRARRMTRFDAFTEWAQGLAMGSLFCYYYNREAREDVKNILEESETEAARYSETEAESLLTRLIFRELEKLAAKADAPEVVPAPETVTA